MAQEPPSAPGEEDVWGTPEEPVSEPRREPLNLRIINGLLDATGDPSAIVTIHSRQSLSSDLQYLSSNILTAIFLIIGAIIIVFGPPEDYKLKLVIGIVFFVIACGIFGFQNFNFKGFGITAAGGQSPTRNTTRTGRGTTRSG
jgi:hypothetical protein